MVETFSFASADDAVKLSSPHCFFAIVDIEKAFRQVPVYPPHRQLQAFSWKLGSRPKYFVDNCLCFGLACGPGILHRISLCIAGRRLCFGYVVVPYLDDFLVIAKTFEECVSAKTPLIRLLVRLGVPPKWQKIVGPTKRIQFLGLVLDSEKQQVELLIEKLHNLVQLVLASTKRAPCQKRSFKASWVT